MAFRILAILALSISLRAQEIKSDRRLFAMSLVSFAGAETFDALSSRGMIEQNPILGRGPFGARQIGIKVSMGGALVAAEMLIIRRFPQTRRAFTWTNFIASGGTSAVAWHNVALR
jgi:hypothetical protein